MGACPTSSSSTAAVAAAWNGSARPSWTGPRPPPTGSRACRPPSGQRADAPLGQGRLGPRRDAGAVAGPRRGPDARVPARGRRPAGRVPGARAHLGVAGPRGAGAAATSLGRPPEVLSLFGYTGGAIARVRQGRRPGRPRGLLPARRGLGSTERRAVRPGRGPDPLARRGRPGRSSGGSAGAATATTASSSTRRRTGTGTAPGRSRSTSARCSRISRRWPARGRRSSCSAPTPQGYDGDRLGALVREHFGVAATGEPMMVVSRAGSRLPLGAWAHSPVR